MASNVSAFEKRFTTLVCDTKNVGVVSELRNTPDDQRPRIFRGKNTDFIVSSAEKCRTKISSILEVDKISLITNQNNRSGSDFVEAITGTDIEIKLGGATDGNLGLSTLEWALEDQGSIHSIMVDEGQLERRQLILDGVTDVSLLEHKRGTAEYLRQHFVSKLTVGEYAPDKLAFLAVCVSRGIKNLNDIEAAWISKLNGELDTEKRTPLMLMRPNGNFILKDKAFKFGQRFIIEHVGAGLRSPATKIIMRSKSSDGNPGFQVEIRQHYKNSYTDREGNKTPARFWVNNACFNMWIRK